MKRALVRGWPLLLLALGLAVTYRFLFAGQLQTSRDLFRLFIPESAFLRERLLAGELPLWNPYTRLGQPFLGTLYTQVLYPPRVVLVLLFGAAWGMNLLIVFHAGLASAGAYLASRALKAPRSAALIAGLFGLTPMFNRLGQAQHVASAAAWSGFIVLGALAVIKAPSWRSSAKVALPLGLSFLCGAPEMVVWQSALVLAAVLWAKHWRRVLPWLALGVGWGVAIGSAISIPAAELLLSWRGPTDALVDRYQWSASVPQLLSMGWLFADEKKALYWHDDQWFITTLFIGAIPCALALLGLRRARRMAPLLVIAAICATLALGSHFFLARWLLQIPPLSFFRYPTKYVVGLAFVISLLAPFGVRRLAVWARAIEPTARRLGFSLVAGFVAIAAAVALARLPYWRTGIAIGVFCFGLASLSLVAAFFLVRPGPRRPTVLRFLIFALACVECAVGQWLVPPVGLMSAAVLETPSTLATAMRVDGVQRVSIVHAEGELPGRSAQSALTPGGEANAFIANSRENLVALRWLEEHLEAVEGYGFRDPDRLTAALEDEPRGVYDLLGVTHFIRTDGKPYEDTAELAAGPVARAYRSTTAFPRAFVATSTQIVDDATALQRVRGDVASLHDLVLLDDGPSLSGAACESRALITEHQAERVAVQVDACANGMLVLSDAYFPGWQARVDGVSTTIHRADFLIRAVSVTAGRHEVVFTYAPNSFRVGVAATLVALISLAASVIRRRRAANS